jgi:RimJ/RimL family protein N-acetyltransferase
VRLVEFHGRVPDLPVAPGWPHADTAPGLSFFEHGGWTWLVLDDDARVAGECGSKGPPDADGRVEIGYGLAAPSRGRGLGTRAVAALLDELAARGVREVVAEVETGNVASRRLLERLGFRILQTDDRVTWYRTDLSTRSTSG